mmetsp:Transcript_6258/g.10737  ORF Transcript_6258/g.10737 Transcript_6258/m.10737 type:complete len:130 (+) Transcript_6258:143-532(+)
MCISDADHFQLVYLNFGTVHALFGTLFIKKSYFDLYPKSDSPSREPSISIPQEQKSSQKCNNVAKHGLVFGAGLVQSMRVLRTGPIVLCWAARVGARIQSQNAQIVTTSRNTPEKNRKGRQGWRMEHAL